MVLIMGMRLDGGHLLLTEEQYNKLKNKELYLKNPYELELIDSSEADMFKKVQRYEALEALYSNGSKDIILSREENLPFEEIVDDIAYDFVESSELPITLDELLDYDYSNAWIINVIKEDKIQDEKVYILMQIRYW